MAYFDMFNIAALPCDSSLGDSMLNGKALGSFLRTNNEIPFDFSDESIEDELDIKPAESTFTTINPADLFGSNSGQREFTSIVDVSLLYPPGSPVSSGTESHSSYTSSRHSSPNHSSQNSSRKRSRLVGIFSDGEVDGFGSNASDDEYHPSPTQPPRKLARNSRAPYSTRHFDIKLERSESPFHASGKSIQNPKRHRQPPGPRHEQITMSLDARKLKHHGGESLVCPVCGWKQSTNRSPDFNRHLLTHNRPDVDDESKGWWCKGVLYNEANLAFFEAPVDVPTYMFAGQRRFGGCKQTFSRRDALKRHLDNEKIECLGKACPAKEEPMYPKYHD